jgi:hypothetical protein
VFGNCKVVHALDREWKLLLRPAEHNLPNLAPLWANRNFILVIISGFVWDLSTVAMCSMARSF